MKETTMSEAENGENTDTGGGSPKERAESARQEAFGAMEAAEDLDRATKRAPAESEAAETFATELANTVVQGFSEANAKSYCSQVAEASKFYNKTELTELLEDEIENTRIADDDRPPLDQLIEQALKEVVIVRTTDAKQSTIYRWDFADCQFETSADKEGRAHFAWPAFRNEYFDAAGRDPSKPTKQRRGGEEWRDFIVEMVRDRGTNSTTRGPRTVAADALQNFIRRTTAYATVEDMFERDGIYIDDDPEDGDPAEIHVPNHDIKRICDDNELSSVRELQIELDARGLSTDRISGVSESTFVNNNKVTYWVLTADIAEPGTYEPEPVDPADQVRQEEAEAKADNDEDDDEDDEDGGEGEASEESDGGDGPPGALGAVGPDPDDEDDAGGETDE
jgi:hypothetical protein